MSGLAVALGAMDALDTLAKKAVPSPPQPKGSPQPAETSWLGRGVTIVLGLLLIAVGLFSMQGTREVIVGTAKKAATAAAVA